MKSIALFIFNFMFFAICSCQQVLDGPFFGNGYLNGWADQNSVVIWTRLTQTPEMKSNGQDFIEITVKEANKLAKQSDEKFLETKQLPEGIKLEDMNGACPGASGEVKLIYEESNGLNKVELDWASVNEKANFTHQWKLEGLSSGTTYNVHLMARKHKDAPISDTFSGTFTTAPDFNTNKKIKFSVVSCHDYIRKDLPNGHKIYQSMLKDNLDFYVHTGDIEYYDKKNPYAFTESLMRFKWDRLLALPLQRDFFSKSTTYFMKDDHDVLCDDAFPGMTYGSVSFERGIEIFDNEQFPSNDKAYKTVRWGKDLQVWLLDGRKYRSKNSDPDGYSKTILGDEQLKWFFETLKASDATYKVVISASPILGPDRAMGKNDNHSNETFKSEGDKIRAFINQFDNVYICNGDRHWQYVTHFEGTNLWEFGSGAGSNSHAGGWKEDDLRPEHRFLRVKGGYLVGEVYQEKDSVKLKFEHRDTKGDVVHTEVFSKTKS